MALTNLRVAFVCITDMIEIERLDRRFIGLAFVLACLPSGQKALPTKGES